MADPSIAPEPEINIDEKFNLGLFNLYKISELLNEIKNITVQGYDLDLRDTLLLGKLQHKKVRLLRQLFHRVVPIIDAKNAAYIEKNIRSMRLDWLSHGVGPPIKGDSNHPVPKNYYEAFNPALEDKIDDTITDMTVSMQIKGKYWMPKASHSRMF